jgi:hypothetical protein
MIFPNGRMEKIMQFAMGGFFLCAVLVPAFSLGKNFDINFKNLKNNKNIGRKLEKKVAGQIKNISSKQIESSINQILGREGLCAKKIELLMDTQNNSSISISKIKLFFDKKYLNQKEKIDGILKKELGQINTQICESQ